MPIFRSTHSRPSTLPVEIAVRGMSPSALFFASAVLDAGTGVLVQPPVTIVNCFRQRPSWMTTGISFTLPAAALLTGTLGRRNLPSGPVVVETSGEPVTDAPHC